MRASVCYRGALWSLSYFAGSVGGASISFARQYIEQQQEIRRALHPPSEGRGFALYFW